MDIFEIKAKVPSKYFDYQKLISIITGQKNPRRFIGNLIKKNYIIRVKKGLYIWGQKIDPSPFSKEILANLIFGPSYISLEYALSYYHLIPERTETMTSVTFKRRKNFQTPLGLFEYEHLARESYPAGVKLEILTSNQSFLIATPEKAVLDLIALRIEKQDLEGNFEKFLEEDLRVDPVEFNKLNRDALAAYARHYKSSTVKLFMEKLEKKKNG